MFEKFTERARKVMSLSRQESQRLHGEFIGTEHILLGIVAEGGGVAIKVLKNLNVDLKKVRQEVEKLITPSTEPTVTLGQLPFSPRSKRVIELAGEAASQLGHEVVGTEHLLLGLIKENEGIAAQVLTNLGLKLEEARDMVVEVLGSAAASKVVGRPDGQSIRITLYRLSEGSLGNQYLVVKDVAYTKVKVVTLTGVPAEKLATIARSIASDLGFDAYTVDPA